MGTLFQDLAAQFNQAFIEADRWQRYLSGIGISFTVTLGALIIGIILGVLVAIIRTLHDQQKGTDRSVLLSVANKFCEFYTTVIRGLHDRDPRYPYDGSAADHGLRYL